MRTTKNARSYQRPTELGCLLLLSAKARLLGVDVGVHFSIARNKLQAATRVNTVFAEGAELRFDGGLDTRHPRILHHQKEVGIGLANTLEIRGKRYVEPVHNAL